ncbi:MAG: hypothetical protein GEU26_14585 [Nitrososphaeraceae archaeon]|nr:hypothetical protein [Nitrososphaeraceae archaeon]
MNYRAIATFGVFVILLATMLLISPHSVFADSYEKSQVVSQINECGNYWFPVNIICSNLNSPTQGDQNDVAMAAITTTDSNINYGAPFP